MRTEERHKIAPEGYPFIVIALIFCLTAWWVHPYAGWIMTALLIFVISFFRNPNRRIPQEKGLLCPADGRVIFAGEALDERYLNRRVNKISIFMSPLNVHVNRSPVNGVVTEVRYNKGKFLGAFDDKASLHNEQNAVLIRDENGNEIVFVQIAGFLARRIVCYAKAGDALKRGSIFGLIRFGSRMDVYFPLTSPLLVKVGQRVKAGETILAGE